jgi:hypothetical protein
MERKFPPGRLQGAPGLPLLNLEKLSLRLAFPDEQKDLLRGRLPHVQRQLTRQPGF